MVPWVFKNGKCYYFFRYILNSLFVILHTYVREYIYNSLNWFPKFPKTTKGLFEKRYMQYILPQKLIQGQMFKYIYFLVNSKIS
jgi:hypothetical protein